MLQSSYCPVDSQGYDAVDYRTVETRKVIRGAQLAIAIVLIKARFGQPQVGSSGRLPLVLLLRPFFRMAHRACAPKVLKVV
jgi:hypothetical protein